MRYLLPLLAACSSGWKQTPAPPAEEPDSRTEYVAEPTPASDDALVMPAPRPCQWQQHAVAAGMTLAVANATKADLDLCLWSDQAIGRLGNINGLTGFALDVDLLSLRVTGTRISCHVLVAVHSPITLVGVFEQTVNVHASSATTANVAITKRDCVQGNIDELVRQRAVPAIKRHALVSSPSTSP
jgi:hypothetical protein